MDEITTCQHCGQTFSTSLFEDHQCDTDDMDNYKMKLPQEEPLKETNNEMMVQRDIMKSIYRIMCGTSGSFNGTQFHVSDQARVEMMKAHRLIMHWGLINQIDKHG